MTTRTLEARIDCRCINNDGSGALVIHHVRAELDRLARQVRKLAKAKENEPCEYILALADVLALLKEAKR